MTKELKASKDDLRLLQKKYEELEEELAVKSLEVKDYKQKKILYDATEDLKSEIAAQKDEIAILSKDNKSLKEELRSNNRQIEDLER